MNQPLEHEKAHGAHCSVVASDFSAWVQSLGLNDPEDGDTAPGTVPAGAWEFLRETFDARGPLSRAEVLQAWDDLEEALARRAVDLVLADLHRTTRLRPEIAIWRHELGALAIAYNGNYSTPAILSLRIPEVVSEAAEYLQDRVVEDLWSPWPICTAHGSALDAAVVDARAVWRCRRDNQVISAIGELPSNGSVV